MNPANPERTTVSRNYEAINRMLAQLIVVDVLSKC